MRHVDGRQWPDSERCVSRQKTDWHFSVYLHLSDQAWPVAIALCVYLKQCMYVWTLALSTIVSVCVRGCVVTGIILLEQAQLPIILFTQPLEPLTQSLSAGLAGLSFTPYKSMGCSPTSRGCVCANTALSVWEKTSAGDSRAMFPGT